MSKQGVSSLVSVQFHPTELQWDGTATTMQRKWLFLILCAFKVFSLVFIAVFKSVFSRVVSV